jgi:hypothetical protein
MHLHYFDEGNACVNWVGYYIVNVSMGYCTNEVNDIVTTRPTWVLQNNKMIQCICITLMKVMYMDIRLDMLFPMCP